MIMYVSHIHTRGAGNPLKDESESSIKHRVSKCTSFGEYIANLVLFYCIYMILDMGFLILDKHPTDLNSLLLFEM